MDFENLGENVRDFIHEKPLISALIGIFSLLFFAAFVIILIQTSEPKAPTPTFKKDSFSADAKLLIPSAPEAEKEYYPSRIVKNAWEEKDVEPWFTMPDDDTLDSLKDANDSIISDIIGAAP